MNQHTQDHVQLSLFAPEARSSTRRMPGGWDTALEQTVLDEALEIYRKCAGHFNSGWILQDLAKKHNLGGYWTRTIHQLEYLGFLDRMYCYWGSDTPCDKTREYRGYSVHHRIKKEFLK